MKTIAMMLLLSFVPFLNLSGATEDCRLDLRNGSMSVSVNADGTLACITNVRTGQNYASGGYLWRMYYDSPDEKEIQVTGDGQEPVVTVSGNVITLTYKGLRTDDIMLDMQLKLDIVLEDGMVRFSSEITNNEPHTVVREFQYPLVRNVRLPEGSRLITAKNGGYLYDNPKKAVLDNSNKKPYMTPAQYFRQMDMKYPHGISMNCFALAAENEGLYFGSHDMLFQDTWHGVRLYPDASGEFTELECGFYKYPHCFAGETWTCDANVIAPYSGTWHKASEIYRRWADTWWDHRETPEWVKNMSGWQRIIFKHQYGEYFFRYEDLYGRIKEVGEDVGADAVLAFGWWKEGMDNGNPDYSPDDTQGGDEAWAAAIEKFKKDGSKLLMYYNGKLIDRGSRFYKSGKGHEVCYKDNTGSELTCHYKFTGMGTWLGEYDARTFLIADTRDSLWRSMLVDMADRAYRCGANSVFYDQLGYGEGQSTDWDLSKEYPVPNLRVLYDKGQALRQIREHIAALDPDFALGTEWLTDYAAQYCDYIHCYPGNSGPYSFQDFFRYTFPEIVFSDRELRDDTDVERRVNLNLLKGIRNDIEIFRCRDLIDKTPLYQAYLRKANAIKHKYAAQLMAGRYNDVFGFTSSNPDVEARSFVGDGKIAVVVTNDMARQMSTVIGVPGGRFVEYSALGSPQVSADGSELVLGQHDLVVLLFEKK